MIWLCVFPTLTAINLTFSNRLRPMSPVLRTFVLATIAVPIVVYALLPYLQRLRARLYRPIACARGRRSVGLIDADPRGTRRRGSEGHTPTAARVTLENTRTAAPSGVQVAVREEGS